MGQRASCDGNYSQEAVVVRMAFPPRSLRTYFPSRFWVYLLTQPKGLPTFFSWKPTALRFFFLTRSHIYLPPPPPPFFAVTDKQPISEVLCCAPKDRVWQALEGRKAASVTVEPL